MALSADLLRDEPAWVRRMRLVAAIKRECERKHITLVTLGERIGQTRGNMYRIINGGRRIPEGFEADVAHALGIPVERLTRSK